MHHLPQDTHPYLTSLADALSLKAFGPLAWGWGSPLSSHTAGSQGSPKAELPHLPTDLKPSARSAMDSYVPGVLNVVMALQ